MSPALLIVLLVIVAGALVVLTRVGMLAVAVIFWFTFAAALGILALSGHAFTANWHLGPVGELLLLEGARALARGVHLPRVHDHRPADGAGDARAGGGSTRSRSACSGRC